MKKIAFVGERIALEPFRALGQEFYPAADAAAAEQVLAGLDLAQYALVVLTPAAAPAAGRFHGPAFLVLPGFRERDTGRREMIREAISRATGRREE